jgi:hypothetical protein
MDEGAPDKCDNQYREHATFCFPSITDFFQVPTAPDRSWCQGRIINFEFESTVLRRKFYFAATPSQGT